MLTATYYNDILIHYDRYRFAHLSTVKYSMAKDIFARQILSEPSLPRKLDL